MWSSMKQLVCGSRTLDMSRVHVMGILNVTPDSFSDGGRYFSHRDDLDKALARARVMLDEGATLIDVGGESTRPGATPVSEQEEMDRVLPVVERIAQEMDVVISVDTSTPTLMAAAGDLGAGMINDVRALLRPGAVDAVAKSSMAVCLMHMQGAPLSMQEAPKYDSVVDEVLVFLRERVALCKAAGIEAKRICLDPGFGFGKTLDHNLWLMNSLENVLLDDLPLLVGTSRKSMIDGVLDKPVDQRLSGGLATVACAVMKGAKIVRVHDVSETVDVVKMTEAILNAKRV